MKTTIKTTNVNLEIDFGCFEREMYSDPNYDWIIDLVRAVNQKMEATTENIGFYQDLDGYAGTADVTFPWGEVKNAYFTLQFKGNKWNVQFPFIVEPPKMT